MATCASRSGAGDLGSVRCPPGVDRYWGRLAIGNHALEKGSRQLICTLAAVQLGLIFLAGLYRLRRFEAACSTIASIYAPEPPSSRWIVLPCSVAAEVR